MTTASGRGVHRAKMTLLYPDGTTKTTSTDRGGYYKFVDVPTGQTYLVTVSNKKSQFNPSQQTVNHIGDVFDINFTSAP